MYTLPRPRNQREVQIYRKNMFQLKLPVNSGWKRRSGDCIWLNDAWTLGPRCRRGSCDEERGFADDFLENHFCCEHRRFLLVGFQQPRQVLRSLGRLTATDIATKEAMTSVFKNNIVANGKGTGHLSPKQRRIYTLSKHEQISNSGAFFCGPGQTF